MKNIISSIMGRLNEFSEHMAQAIRDSDWKTVAQSVGIALAAVLSILALVVVILILIGKALGTLLGKIIAVPLVLFILGLSYKMNLEDSRKEHHVDSNAEALERWAGQVYFYVRDSIYYVFRAVARRTSVQMPDDPADIEMRNQFFRRGGHMVFQFYAQVLGTQDKVKFEQKLTDTIVQLHKDGRFVGLSEELVEVNGRLYCPLQVLNVEEHDGGFVVQIVFADEETIPLVERSQERQRKALGKTLYDDES